MSLSEETEMLLSQLVDHELPVARANEVLADVLDNAEARQRLKDMLQLRRLLSCGRPHKSVAARPIGGL